MKFFFFFSTCSELQRRLDDVQKTDKTSEKHQSEIERKLRNIINGNKPKYITINKKKYYVSRPKIDEIKLREEKEGGLLPLIPLIIGAVTAAGSVAGGPAGIAKAVNDKKAADLKQEEQERHNKEMEKIAKEIKSGSGIHEAIRELSKMATHLSDMDRRFLKNTLYNLSEFIPISKSGDGLFLNPYGYAKQSLPVPS